MATNPKDKAFTILDLLYKLLFGPEYDDEYDKGEHFLFEELSKAIRNIDKEFVTEVPATVACFDCGAKLKLFGDGDPSYVGDGKELQCHECGGITRILVVGKVGGYIACMAEGCKCDDVPVKRGERRGQCPKCGALNEITISLVNPTRKPKLDLVLEHLAATELDRVCDAIREHFGNEIAEEVDVRLSVEDSVDDAIRTLSWVLKNYPKPKLNRKAADEINQEDLEAAAGVYDRLVDSADTYDRWFQVQCPSCGDTVTNGNSSRTLFEGRLLHCKNCEMGITLIFDKHPKP